MQRFYDWLTGFTSAMAFGTFVYHGPVNYIVAWAMMGGALTFCGLLPKRN